MALILVTLDSCTVSALMHTLWYGAHKEHMPVSTWGVGDSHTVGAHGVLVSGKPLSEIKEDLPPRAGADYKLTESYADGLRVLQSNESVATHSVCGIPCLAPIFGWGKVGWDSHVNPKGGTAYACLQALKKLELGDRTFVMLNVGDTHYYYGGGQDDERIVRSHRYCYHEAHKAPLPENYGWKYWGMQIAKADSALELLYGELLRDHWWVVTADHGEAFPQFDGGKYGHWGWNDCDSVMTVPWFSNVPELMGRKFSTTEEFLPWLLDWDWRAYDAKEWQGAAGSQRKKELTPQELPPHIRDKLFKLEDSEKDSDGGCDTCQAKKRLTGSEKRKLKRLKKELQEKSIE